MPIERILIGVDGSDDSRRALEWAADLAVALGADLVAAHALGLLEQLSDGDEPVPAAARRDEVVRAFEEEWCSPLDERDGLRSQRIVDDGPPGMVLLRLVERMGIDLVVVGSRGIGGFGGQQLGSTSTQLAQHSPVPVTVIPGPPR